MRTFEVLTKGEAVGVSVGERDYMRMSADFYSHGRGVWYEFVMGGFRYLGDELSRSLEADYLEQMNGTS